MLQFSYKLELVLFRDSLPVSTEVMKPSKYYQSLQKIKITLFNKLCQLISRNKLFSNKKGFRYMKIKKPLVHFVKKIVLIKNECKTPSGLSKEPS